ncbi:hypothetical protein [Soonwooa sp.]|uniref:hypothetical protein n=1 Tax=Soonwooa sp. TaxID=1938592 RepID=UPI00261A2643|nr:hypothetical protein [Soonwooa sp.]
MEDKVFGQIALSFVLLVFINAVSYQFLFKYLELGRISVFYFNPIMTLFFFLILWLLTMKSDPVYSNFFKKAFKFSAIFFVFYFFIPQFLIGLGAGNK